MRHSAFTVWAFCCLFVTSVALAANDEPATNQVVRLDGHGDGKMLLKDYPEPQRSRRYVKGQTP